MKKNFTTTKKQRLALIAGIAVGLIAPVAVSSGSVSAASTQSTSKYYAAGGNTQIRGITVSGFDGRGVLAVISTDQAAATIAVTTTTGLTLSYGYTTFSGASISFFGRQADMNAALATLTLTMPTSTTSSAVKIKTMFTEAKVGLAYYPANQHFYKFVAGKISGTNAFAAVATQKEFGLTGYLASITSSGENDFVASKVEGAKNVWIGATDLSKEGEWKWVGGPEDGKQFWSGNCTKVDGKVTEGYYGQWATGEPNNYISATNKCGGTAYDVNSSQAGEDCAVTNWNVSDTLAAEKFGYWNDLPCSLERNWDGTDIGGYVVEFGSSTNGSVFDTSVDFQEHTLVKAVPTQKLSPVLAKLKSFFSNFSKTDLKKGFKIFARKPATKTKPAQTIKCPPMKKTRLSYTLLFEEAGRYSFYFTNDKGKRIPMQCGTKIKTRVITEQISAPVIQSVKAGEKPVITVYLQTSQFGDPRYYPQLNVILKRTDGIKVY